MDTQAPRLNCTVLTVHQVAYTLPWAKGDRCQVPAERVWEAERVAIEIDLDRPVPLLVRVSVHHCPACDHFFRAQPPFLRPDATYANHVVMKAMQSVRLDGMAMSLVSERMGRDFWAKPSEASIRLWCREQAARLDLAGDYQQWVVQEFSGVLCVDEVYQGELALLLAVDQAEPEGDRLVGFQLLRGHVEQRQVEEFLLGLREAGIVPAEVVTDGSSLYPMVLAKVWPTADHQPECPWRGCSRWITAGRDGWAALASGHLAQMGRGAPVRPDADSPALPAGASPGASAGRGEVGKSIGADECRQAADGAGFPAGVVRSLSRRAG
ncbi:MAG: hypothetical protein ACUVWR_19030 [Anaerolineae bacterium]